MLSLYYAGFSVRKSGGRAGPARLCLGLSVSDDPAFPPGHPGETHSLSRESVKAESPLVASHRNLYRLRERVGSLGWTEAEQGTRANNTLSH